VAKKVVGRHSRLNTGGRERSAEKDPPSKRAATVFPAGDPQPRGKGDAILLKWIRHPELPAKPVVEELSPCEKGRGERGRSGGISQSRERDGGKCHAPES